MERKGKAAALALVLLLSPYSVAAETLSGGIEERYDLTTAEQSLLDRLDQLKPGDPWLDEYDKSVSTRMIWEEIPEAMAGKWESHSIKMQQFGHKDEIGYTDHVFQLGNEQDRRGDYWNRILIPMRWEGRDEKRGTIEKHFEVPILTRRLSKKEIYREKDSVLVMVSAVTNQVVWKKRGKVCATFKQRTAAVAIGTATVDGQTNERVYMKTCDAFTDNDPSQIADLGRYLSEHGKAELAPDGMPPMPVPVGKAD